MSSPIARLTFVCTIVSLIVLRLLLPGQSYAKFDSENARGIWLFDEGRGNIVTMDFSGNGNDGEIWGGEKWVPGKFGMALRFDGEDDELRLGTDESLNPSEALTIVTWIFIEKYSARGEERTIFERENTYRLVILAAAGSEGAARFGLGVAKVVDTVDTVPLKEWYHVAATYDGNIGRIYFNGSVVAEDKIKGKISINIDARTTVASGSHGLFKGAIDEVALFDVALAETDINHIMTRGLDLAIFAVSPSGKLTTTWASIKESK